MLLFPSTRPCSGITMSPGSRILSTWKRKEGESGTQNYMNVINNESGSKNLDLKSPILIEKYLSEGLATICDRIWEKDQLHAFSEFSFKNAYISGVIAAMNLKLGMIFFHHPATVTINFEPHPLPTWAERAASTHVDCVRKSLFRALLWWLTAQDRSFAIASNVRSVK